MSKQEKFSPIIYTNQCAFFSTFHDFLIIIIKTIWWKYQSKLGIEWKWRIVQQRSMKGPMLCVDGSGQHLEALNMWHQTTTTAGIPHFFT